jgi:hypothetical protein
MAYKSCSTLGVIRVLEWRDEFGDFAHDIDVARFDAATSSFVVPIEPTQRIHYR